MEIAGVAPVELRILGSSRKPPAKEGRPKPVLGPVDPEIGQFDVQVGAFKEWSNAYRLRDRLQAAWPRVHVIRYREFLRVRVGPFPNEREAREAVPVLQEEGFDPFVVRHDAEEEGA